MIQWACRHARKVLPVLRIHRHPHTHTQCAGAAHSTAATATTAGRAGGGGGGMWHTWLVFRRADGGGGESFRAFHCELYRCRLALAAYCWPPTRGTMRLAAYASACIRPPTSGRLATRRSQPTADDWLPPTDPLHLGLTVGCDVVLPLAAHNRPPMTCRLLALTLG